VHSDLRALDAVLTDPSLIIPIGMLHQRLQQHALAPELHHLVFTDAIHLWGLIRHANGTLLGIVLIGPRGDLDPYRDRDLWELQRLLTDAGLAFTNSLSYAEQVQAKQTIAWLYQHMQDVEAQTTAELARKIHDDVLNNTMRLNLDSLRRICPDLPPGPLRRELQAVLDGETASYDALRDICLELKPSTNTDPYGVTAGIRTMIEQLRPTWSGAIHFTVAHDVIPLPHHTQRELVRIAREAIINAIKHADATIVVVTISFPPDEEVGLQLRIRDNGRAQQAIAPRAGHLGLHFMQASATAIRARLVWERVADGGTDVVVQLHRDHIPPEVAIAAAPLIAEEPEVVVAAEPWLVEHDEVPREASLLLRKGSPA
jgi:signal transduction histidine kinase